MSVHRGRQTWTVAAGVFFLALVVRVVSGSGLFFMPAVPGHRVFEIFDSTYQLRRVEMTLAQYPRVPFTDPYHYFPDVPDVPWPPGYTLFLATVVKVLTLGGHGAALVRETILGFIPSVIDALSTALFFLLFRRLFSLPVALLAGALLAFSSQNISYSELGYIDHHYFITFLTVTLAWLFQFYDERRTGSRAVLLGAWAGGMVFFNVSAIQYSILGLMAVGGAAFFRRQEESLWSTAPLVFAGACGVSLFAAFSTPAGRAGLITYDQTSLFQFLLIFGLSGAWVVGAAVVSLAGVRRWMVAGLTLGGLVVLAATLWPNIIEGARFLLAGNLLNGIQGEEVSLRVYGHRWYEVFTLFAVFLPFGIRRLWEIGKERPTIVLFLSLFLVHGLLSGTAHFLYVQYLFPWYALTVALGVAWVVPRLPEALRYAALIPFVAQTLFAVGRTTFDKKSTGEVADRNAIAQTVQAYSWLQEHSPPVDFSGQNPAAPPYSVFAHRDHGHLIVARAGRPVIVSPFSTTAFVRHMQDYVRGTFELDEEAFVAILDRYRARYLALDFRDNIMVPFLVGVLRNEPDHDRVAAMAEKKLFSVRNNLLFFDGELRWRGTPSIKHFRLVYEVPKVVTTPLQTPQGPVKHSYNGLKIFQRVPGATLIGRGWPPNERVVARLPLKTNTGRTFTYSAFARADAFGSVTIPVAYPTEALADSGVVPLANSYAVGVTSSSVRNVPVSAIAIDNGEQVAMALK
ncbi:MAG: glycosyltransferase family 39 protein [Elusimicrobia bacterium]|nr:glycosyltransferase family 39 protein [Elusimicrobiota bacterium]